MIKQNLSGGLKMAELKQLLSEMPPFVARNHPRFKEWTGYSGRTMANLDYMGEGPKEKIQLGRTIAYPRESLVEWLEERSKKFEQNQHRPVKRQVHPLYTDKAWFWRR